VAAVTLEQVTKVYPNGVAAVAGLDLEVGDGELLVLVGPSGCGKSTALRMVAGLEEVTEGVLRIGGRVVNDLPPKERDIAMVFQNYALYPHMTVEQNIGFALKLQRRPREEIRKRVGRAAWTLQIEEWLRRKPGQLSGGQRQRVAMGRAIVRDPAVFLMDEPLSNLDAKLRVQMRAEIAQLQRELGTTTVYVTHDQVEAMTLGDRVAVLRDGRLQQVCQPERLYAEPANLFVAGFIGSPSMNLLEGRLELPGRDDQAATVLLGEQALAVPPRLLFARPALRRYAGQPLLVGIRPEHLVDAGTTVGYHGTGADLSLRARVEHREALGSELILHLRTAAHPAATDETRTTTASGDPPANVDRRTQRGHARVVARFEAHSHARIGDIVELVVDTDQLHFFDYATGNRIS
jgi:multiple sugar transport system ATP-binding protein